MRKHEFNVPIYKSLVRVFIGDELDESVMCPYAYNSAKELKFGVKSEALCGKYNDEEVGHAYFFVLSPNIGVGDLCHECKHLVNNIFIDIGAELDANNDETECYLLGWLVDTVYDLLFVMSSIPEEE